jgi:hypothetical protein
VTIAVAAGVARRISPMLDNASRHSIRFYVCLFVGGMLALAIAVAFVVAGLTCAHAQQTITPVTPPAGLPSTFPQFQTYASCLMNCDTRVGQCQSTCSVSNSPAFTFAPTTTGTPTRPDPGAVSQCFIACNSQALACKQTCTPPH